MTSGERIKRFRKEKGLKQQELADKLGVTQSLIASWEVGVRNPKKETLDKIAVVLGVPVIKLIGFDFQSIPVEEILMDISTKDLLAELERRCNR